MKRRFRLCFTSPLLLVLAGACAGPSQSANKSTASEEQEFAVVTNAHNTVPPKPGDALICEYEETVGSHIPRRICRSKTELENTRAETQEMMRNLRPVPPKPQ